MISILAVFIPILAINLYAQKSQGFAQEEINSLIQTVKSFTAIWYQEKDEIKFLDFIVADAPLRKVPNAFSGAFLDNRPGNAEKETLKVSFRIPSTVFRGETIIGKVTLPLNSYITSGEYDVFPDGFVVMAGNDLVLSEVRRDLFDTAESIERAKTDKIVPRQKYFLVIYNVTGTGYSNEELFTFWVQENSRWKLFSFFAG